eukprot:TRINITY_DN17873_c0_g1_i1.p2 TRINITY_DN17873_c0_g1~~TRINITY_DN17873_c0_g1_i1.p2  ORF type:complete len:187 (-),score=41.71 TRINITY_DN17873_c0_g1_i1:261-821(-)
MAALEQALLDDPHLGTKCDFEEKEYDVTDFCFMILCCGAKKLHLKPNEVVYTESNCILSNTRRLNYGELEKVGPNHCCCFNGILSNITEQPMSPGCCGIGQREFVIEVAMEMRNRMMHRGDAANLKRAEESLDRLARLTQLAESHHAKLDLILKHLKIDVPSELGALVPPQQSMGQAYGAAAGQAS